MRASPYMRWRGILQRAKVGRLVLYQPEADKVVDPRILFDHHRGRWAASGIDPVFGGSDKIVLAVSKNSDPFPLPTATDPGNWTKHVVDFGTSGGANDFDTLGLDDNGIYLSVIKLSNFDHKILAIRKSTLYDTQTTQNFTGGSGATWYKIFTESYDDVDARTLQPAVNFDSVDPDGYAIFVAKGSPQMTPYGGGSLRYRRLKWPGPTGLPDWADPSWQDLPNSAINYQDYFDLDDGTGNAPQMGGLWILQLGGDGAGQTQGSALSAAVIRGGYLSTCQHVGLDGTDGDYDGGSDGQAVDRTAIQWFKLAVSGTDYTITYADHGRIADREHVTAPYFYYYPSIMVNGSGDVVVGFSGSSANSYINAYYAKKPSTSASFSGPIPIAQGSGVFEGSYWGDYSGTCLDPDDDDTFWTVQDYAGQGGDLWKTRIAEIVFTP